MQYTDSSIAIVGLGYVGLPLANAFSIKHDVLGYDYDSERVKELNQGLDHTNQISTRDLKKTLQEITFTDRSDLLSDYNIYIITVPTPIDKLNNPNLVPLQEASEAVGRFLKKDDIVIYESTVYPGATLLG